MDFWEAVSRRRSIRDFDPSRPVPVEAVEQLLSAAVRAPSAGNLQPWHFVVVRDEDTRANLALAAYGQSFVAVAPVVIAVCADPARSAERYGSRGRDLYCLQDTAAATAHLLLTATALGLGACWVGAFDEDAAAGVLGLPSGLRPVALVPVGYPGPHNARSPSRRGVRGVVSYL
jgi:nitroreductase